jgi:hypothetical protein
MWKKRIFSVTLRLGTQGVPASRVPDKASEKTPSGGYYAKSVKYHRTPHDKDNFVHDLLLFLDALLLLHPLRNPWASLAHAIFGTLWNVYLLIWPNRAPQPQIRRPSLSFFLSFLPLYRLMTLPALQFALWHAQQQQLQSASAIWKRKKERIKVIFVPPSVVGRDWKKRLLLWPFFLFAARARTIFPGPSTILLQWPWVAAMDGRGQVIIIEAVHLAAPTREREREKKTPGGGIGRLADRRD